MIHIQPFKPSEWYDKIEQELAQGHWQETEAHLSDTPPKLSRETYEALDERGSLIAIGAFDGERIVGYAVAFICEHAHYGTLYAAHDSLYIAPEYRVGRTGIKMMRAVEEEAKARGATFIAWHAKPQSTFHQLLQRLGYAEEEVVYQRRF